MNKVVRILFLLLLIPVISSCSPSGADGAVSVSVVEPLDGAEVSLGDLVTFRTELAVPSGVNRVDLVANGVLIRSDVLNTPLQRGSVLQAWRPDAEGVYEIYVAALSGENYAASGKVSIRVGPMAEPEVPTTEPPTAVPTITLTETAALTATPTPTFTPEATVMVLPPTSTPTRTIQPLAAPGSLYPQGSIKCSDTTGGVTLSWSAVTHPGGISGYEWEIEGGGISDSGFTTDTEVQVHTIACFTGFTWKVRALGEGGDPGPYAEAVFTAE